MPFIGNPSVDTDVIIENLYPFWPHFSSANVRDVMRLHGDIPDARLKQLICDAMIDVNSELDTWATAHIDAGRTFNDLPLAQQHQYRRAVYASAQAQLLSDMRDYDTTATGQDKADELAASIDVQRRVATLAIRSILGKSRSHIELI